MATQRAVAAKSFGTNIVGIVGAQTAFGTKVSDVSGMRSQIVEFRPPYTLTPHREFYPADRMKGSPSPDDMVEGMESGGGSIHFYADPLASGFWIARLLGGTVTSTPFAALSDPIAIGNVDSQPKAQLAAVTTAPIPPLGLRSAKLTLTYSSAPSAGEVVIVGRDLNGSRLQENLVADGSASVFTPRRFYGEVISVIPDSGLTISGTPALHNHEIAFTKDVGEGLTLEVQEGNVDLPITYQDMFLIGGGLFLENVVRLQVETFAHKVFPRESIAGTGTATPLTTPFSRLSSQALIAKWGMSLEIESEDFRAMDRVYPVEMIGFNLNELLAPPMTAYAESPTYPKVVRKGNRSIGWNAVVDHTLEANFDQFVGGPRFKCVVTAVSKPYGGQYHGIVFEAGRTQMISSPRRIANNLGEVKQLISGRATGQGSVLGNDEGTMRIINSQATL